MSQRVYRGRTFQRDISGDAIRNVAEDVLDVTAVRASVIETVFTGPSIWWVTAAAGVVPFAVLTWSRDGNGRAENINPLGRPAYGG